MYVTKPRKARNKVDASIKRLLLVGPLKPNSPPRKPRPKSADHNIVPLLQLLLPFPEQKRYRGRCRVPVAVDIDHHLFGRYAQTPLHGIDDTQVRLMRGNPYLGGIQVVPLDNSLGHIGHLDHRPFENSLALLIDIMPTLVHRLMRGRKQRTARLHMQMLGTAAVGSHHLVQNPVFLRSRFQQHSPGSIPENRAGSPVGIVDHRRHLFRPYQHHFLVTTRFHITGRRRQGINKTRASRTQIESKSIADTQFVGNQTRSGRKTHIRRHRGANQQIHLLRLGPRLAEQIAYGFHSHIGSSFATLALDPTFLDSDTFHDPFVAGIHHAAQLLVGQHIVGKISPNARYDSMYFFHRKLFKRG